MVDERITRLVRAAAVVVALYQRDELNPAALYDLEMAVIENENENENENGNDIESD